MNLPGSNVWPVAQRELREGARRPVNHRLRLFSAGVGTLLMWVIVGHLNGPTDEAGSWLLIGLHLALIGLILVVAPALTSDCISRERREGTLGLLFLTPLNAESIVAGKIVAHGLRAFTLWLAVLPILTIPFITGGVMAPEFSLYNRPPNLGSMLFVIAFTYGAMALLAYFMLRQRLSRRIYSF